ncbi:hypothetical protein [Kaistia adipata]|uniref:hypothetical protein n=1 Tax=Kaistia adipata TaxID=166954 RepID=UPI00048E358A|nr:hypothetical protein [Kaistia adipata]
MASDRSAAKDAIQDKSKDDPELNAAISSGHDLQLKLTQEENRHAEKMHLANIGWLGRAFGGEQSAPTYIAFLAMVIGLGGTAYCWLQATGTPASPVAPEQAEFWSKQAERALSFGAAALAFIFGRGAK